MSMSGKKGFFTLGWSFDQLSVVSLVLLILYWVNLTVYGQKLLSVVVFSLSLNRYNSDIRRDVAFSNVNNVI